MSLIHIFLVRNAEQIKNGCGQDVALKYVLDLRDFPGSPVEDKLVHDFSVIEQDPEVSVVVELSLIHISAFYRVLEEQKKWQK